MNHQQLMRRKVLIKRNSLLKVHRGCVCWMPCDRGRVYASVFLLLPRGEETVRAEKCGSPQLLTKGFIMTMFDGRR